MQRVRKATILDVAKLANVSQTTVTRALNKFKQTSISPETRERVMEAVKELKYSPSLMAQQLKTGRSRVACLVFVESQDTVTNATGAGPITLQFNDQVSGARSILEPIGYRLETFHANSFRKAEEALPQMFSAGYFEALFLPYRELRETARQLAGEGCIVIGDFAPVKELPTLISLPGGRWRMDFSPMYEEVIRQGRKRILTTFPIPDKVSSTFANELQSGQIRLDYFDREERPRLRFINAIVERVLSEPIDAIMTADEFLGWEIFKRLQQCGVEVPGRVTITGAADVRHVFKPLPILVLGYAEKAMQTREMGCCLLERLIAEDGSVKFPMPRRLKPYRSRVQTMTPDQFLAASRVELCREHLQGEVEAEILGDEE